MKRIVLIGDLIESRKITDRNMVQKILQDILKKVNKNDSNKLSPYTITLGDEFQAVLDNSENLFSDSIAIMLALFPVKVRFSIGIGSIATAINKTMAIGMDGEAFHNARQGIEEIKKTSYLYNLTGIRSEYSNLINQCLFLISTLIRKWNKNQLQIFYELNKNTKVKDISKILGITEQAIYKSINKEEMKVILNIIEELSEYINKKLK